MAKTPITSIMPLLALCAALASMTACATASPGQTDEPPADGVPVEAQQPLVAEPTAVPPEEPAFDPSMVSVELKQTTFVDVRSFMENLNSIIQAKNYAAWSAFLTEEYKAYYSDPEVLARLSSSSVLKRQGITLKTLEDFFLYVVYPSRQHDRVDDIEFTSASHIRAITINSKGERLVLYNLEKVDDTWMIAIWR